MTRQISKQVLPLPSDALNPSTTARSIIRKQENAGASNEDSHRILWKVRV
ncbi:hypothetical protein GDO81_009605 [Engystomops pustulosus]|uniref:Uncharacterized protein n=1 Tax=Engystomops pustulosus TaxID=76066 RepID=A0AAV7BS90_ENGPU|nr:hypothetical protein GDO81_009605 [Engystomops pustulosus]